MAGIGLKAAACWIKISKLINWNKPPEQFWFREAFFLPFCKFSRWLSSPSCPKNLDKERTTTKKGYSFVFHDCLFKINSINSVSHCNKSNKRYFYIKDNAMRYSNQSYTYIIPRFRWIPQNVVFGCKHSFGVHLLTRGCLELRRGQHIHKSTHQDGWSDGARSIQMINYGQSSAEFRFVFKRKRDKQWPIRSQAKTNSNTLYLSK